MRWLPACALALALGACGGGGDGAVPASVEPLAQQRSPETCNYQNIYITVALVRVRRQGAEERWHDIPLATPKRIDLMASGGLFQALGAVPLTPGRYDDIRLVLKLPTVSPLQGGGYVVMWLRTLRFERFGHPV